MKSPFPILACLLYLTSASCRGLVSISVSVRIHKMKLKYGMEFRSFDNSDIKYFKLTLTNTSINPLPSSNYDYVDWKNQTQMNWFYLFERLNLKKIFLQFQGFSQSNIHSVCMKF